MPAYSLLATVYSLSYHLFLNCLILNIILRAVLLSLSYIMLVWLAWTGPPVVSICLFDLYF